jgi:IS30 family transposase
MSLDERISAFLAHADAEPARSKLEPYADLIRTLRQRRWTYVQIAQALRDEFTLSVHPTTIHAFVKVRAKRKTAPSCTPEATSPIAKRPRFNLDA